MLQKTGEKEGTVFVGRTSVIDQLKQSVSKGRTAALLAPSGHGRTSLLKHLAAQGSAAYIDLRKLSISPESFALDLIGALYLQLSAKKDEDILKYQSLETLKQLKLDKACSAIISSIDNELQKIKPDQQLLLKSAFSFAEAFAAASNKKATVIINNFEELLKLNNFPQVNDVLTLFFGSVEKNRNAHLIVASSASRVMKGLLKKQKADVFDLNPLDAEETRELFERIAGKSDDRITKEIYALSAGIPLIVRRIALRFRGEKTGDTQKNIALVKNIIISELSTTGTQSYFYCSKLFTGSLNRARGESLLKSILKAVSQNRPLRLTEIARLIYRSGPVTKSLLERLIEVDMIEKTGNTFDFSNPVLKLWCRLMFSSIEFDEFPDDKTLERIRGML